MELAVVVVIVGVLSVIAVVGYRRLMNSSKISEAQNVISAIRVAQEDYKTEKGSYADIGAAKYCPNNASTPPSGVKTAWNPACNGGVSNWDKLTVHTDGPVVFGYRTRAATADCTTLFNDIATTVVDVSSMNKVPCYIIDARSDLNNDGSTGLYTELVGTSTGSTIYQSNVGE